MKFTLPDFEVRDAFGALSETVGWGLKDHNIPNAWSITKGENVNLYLLDTGFPDHKDLGDAIKSYINCTETPDVADKNGHATAICSVLAAQENDEGLVGIAPKMNIVCVKTMDDQGVGTVPAMWKALQFVLDEANSGGRRTGGYAPNIVVMSLGSKQPLPDFLYATLKRIHEMGVIIVCAAGNSGREVEYPAAYPECISVGSYDPNGRVSDFSARGVKVDFISPGREIYACWLNNGYKIVKGTSFAAPFLAAIIALILSKYPELKNVNDVKRILVKYSVDRGEAGRDDSYGYGSIDINKLLNDPNADKNLPTLAPVVKKKVPWWRKMFF